MRKFVAVAVAILVVIAAGSLIAEEKKAPDLLVYEAKPGTERFSSQTL